MSSTHQDRTYAVTGAASGIGAATAAFLRERGGRVIACDLHGADVIGDLATAEGRAALVDGVSRLRGGRLDAIVANAADAVLVDGVSPSSRPETTWSLPPRARSDRAERRAAAFIFFGVRCA